MEDILLENVDEKNLVNIIIDYVYHEKMNLVIKELRKKNSDHICVVFARHSDGFDVVSWNHTNITWFFNAYTGMYIDIIETSGGEGMIFRKTTIEGFRF